MLSRNILPQFPSVDAVTKTLSPSYPVYCVHSKRLEINAKVFLQNFPGAVLYAVKCNPHQNIIHSLYHAGIRDFDTASLAEISSIKEKYPNAQCYFMHPSKPRAAIESADKVYGISNYVIDSFEELRKITEELVSPNGKTIFVRLKTKNFGATYELSNKFGLDPAEAPLLLKAVEKAGFSAALCFHVGSQCLQEQAYFDALKTVQEIIHSCDVPIRAIDIGGGFPTAYEGISTQPIENLLQKISSWLKELVVPKDCIFMCEPGRALVADTIDLLVQVILRKKNSLYLNDGIFHSLSEATHAGFRFPMRMISHKNQPSSDFNEFTLFGPTCDSVDVINYPVSLPSNIQEGDWIVVQKCGAYSNALTSQFNGFHPETFVSIL